MGAQGLRDTKSENASTIIILGWNDRNSKKENVQTEIVKWVLICQSYKQSDFATKYTH